MKAKKGFNWLILIIIILVIALLSLVGLNLWKYFENNSNSNSNNTTPTPSTTTTPTPTPVSLVKFTANSGLGYTFSFSYPENWTKTESFTASDSNTGLARDKISVVSPSGKITVKYDIGYMGGLGGTCDENSAEITAVGGLNSYFTNFMNGIANASVVQYMYTKNGVVKAVKTYISNKSEFTINGNYCQQFLTGIVALTPKTEKDGGNYWSGIWSTDVISTDVQNSDGTMKDNIKTTDIDTVRLSQEYQQAKAILVSSAYSKL